MRTDFIKMHGLGNDFVVLDGRAQALPAMTPVLVRALADRHTGIGCDQLVVLEASDTADLKVRFFNHDGGEVQSCGNASRAVGLLLGQPAEVETLGGLIRIAPDGGGITVDMGQPRFEWDQIPLAYPMDTHTMPVAWEALDAPTAVNVGNPHVVFFVADTAAVELDRLGPEIEHDPLFPERINVNVATIASRTRIHLRVWERGAGETLACGTGACATAIGAMRRGLTERAVTVSLPGGDLRIEWTDAGRILMNGPAVESFRGTFDPAAFGAT
ncbi:MAG: diaminopimelate epimerase [Sphingomonadaceae bacterium]|nr:diaminopimelate epimerase [Sphingomonadaceae bacterium]